MADPSLEETFRARLRDHGFARWMGFELVSVDRGASELRLALQPHHLNPGGIAHGGIAASLLDSAIGLALRTTLPDGATHVTLHLEVTYLRRVGEGTITARGTAVHTGRSIEYGEGSLTDADGRLLVRGSATFAVIDRG